MKRVVWTAVIAATLSLISILAVALDKQEMAVPVGLAAIAMAILATREK